jgi:carbon-monoxide dehydrogenase small subunit
MMNIEFTLNGNLQRITITSVERAFDVLINQCGIKSFSEISPDSDCSNCLILYDGKPVCSYILPAFLLREQHVETIEYFAKSKEYDLLSAELEKEGLLSCTYCNNSLMLVAMELVHRSLTPSLYEISDILASLHCQCIDPRAFANTLLKLIQQLAIARKLP